MKHVTVLAILIAIAFAMVRNKISHGPYGYDEADYMFAASLGMERNWFDTGSMPLTDFVATGRRSGADASQQAGLSAVARTGSDPVVYRHWHGPLYYFWLTVPSSLRTDEHTTRALSLVFPLLTVLAIYFGSLFIVGKTAGRTAGQAAAILGSALFLWSPVTLETSELAPHMLFVLCYVCGLMSLARAATGGGRRAYYAAVFCAGLAFCTLEIAFVLILVLAIFAWWQRAELNSDWRLVRNSAGVLAGTILVVWPASLVKLDFLKAYMVMAYLAVFRKGAWGDVTLAQTWTRRFAITPVECCLIAAAVVLFVADRKVREHRAAVVFPLFGALAILATLRVYTEATRYMTPFWAALQIFTAWVLARLTARLERPIRVYGMVAAICCLLIWNAQRRLSVVMLHEDPRAFATIDDLRSRGLGEKTVAVPTLAIPTLHYYFPHMRTQGYADAREIGASGQADAVVYPDGSVRVDGAGSGR